MRHTSMARTIGEAGQVVQMCDLSWLLLLLLLLLLPFHSPHVILAWFYPTPSVTDDRRERNNVVSTVSRFQCKYEVALRPHCIRRLHARRALSPTHPLQQLVRWQQQPPLPQHGNCSRGVSPPENHEEIVWVPAARDWWRSEWRAEWRWVILRIDAAATLASVSKNVRLVLLKKSGKLLSRWQNTLSPHVCSQLDHVTVSNRSGLLSPLHNIKRQCQNLKLIIPRRSTVVPPLPRPPSTPRPAMVIGGTTHDTRQVRGNCPRRVAVPCAAG